MKVFVARQPIFDTRQRVVAYELLFRSGPENFFPNIDGDVASSRVINDSMMTFGLGALVGTRKVYINVTRRILCDELYAVLPVRNTVVELLETIEPDAETVAACRDLKRAGYELALDDYVDRPAMDPLVALADVIKIDFLATSVEQRQALRERLTKRKPALLAEKVETAAVFREARAQGYQYFQGYFFQRPEIITRNEIPSFKLNHLDFLRELQAPDLNFDRLEKVIRRDVSLSIKLLRYLNSAAFYWRSKVTSLKSALVLLGERPFRKWASLIAIVGFIGDGPAELATTCLARAHFCESLCRVTGRTQLELDGFLIGMLSAIDALVGRPLPEILQDIAVSREIEQALLGTASPLGKIRAIVLGYEGALWDEVSTLAQSLGIAETALPELYQQSLDWAAQALPQALPK
jgi:c-di-GMP-related signal transduction protein